MTIKIKPEHLQYCNTKMQREKIQLVIDCGSVAEALKQTGLKPTSFYELINKVVTRAARAGYAPNYIHHESNLPGFTTKRISTARKADGSTALEWHIQEPSKEQQAESFRKFVEGLNENIIQAEPCPLAAQEYASDLMPSIFIGDAHIGMYAYGKETKHDDFDTSIATEQLRNAIDYLLERAEPAETGLLVDVGDFTHANGAADTTFAGTKLDVDTRHHRVMKEAGMVMRYMIDKMLLKFQKVVVVVARGNHNTDAAVAVQLMLEFYYAKEPRVNVLPTEGFYHYIEYGKWLLGITHGDKQKAESLAGSMARDMSEAWGRTTHRMWCTGHYHKEAVKTLPGCKHKVFAALPPPDSWHASHGFAGDGEMEMMTFRKSGGVHSSHVYNIPRPILEPDVRI